MSDYLDKLRTLGLGKSGRVQIDEYETHTVELVERPGGGHDVTINMTKPIEITSVAPSGEAQ